MFLSNKRGYKISRNINQTYYRNSIIPILMTFYPILKLVIFLNKFEVIFFVINRKENTLKIN